MNAATVNITTANSIHQKLAAAAQRLHAPRTDLDRVIASLFAPLSDEPHLKPSRYGPRTNLTPNERDEIRLMLLDGHESRAIAIEIGCPVRTVSHERATMTRQGLL